MTLRSGVIAGVLLVAVYWNYPPPEPSDEMAEWLTSGQYMDHNGHKIFFKNTKGRRADGPALLLLHGFPTHSYDWIKVLPALQEKFSRVLLYDYIGFGFSDKPRDYTYSIMDQADIAEELLSRLQVSSTHILAHDYGDTVAQELMARYEEGASKVQLLSVCLLNGGIFPETHNATTTQQLLLIPYVGVLLAQLSNGFAFKRGLSEVFGAGSEPSAEDLSDWWAAMRYQDGNARLHQLIQYIPERRANRERWVAALQKTTLPLHVVWGPADPVNPLGFVDYYKQLVPGGSISVLASHIGHYPQWEDPRFTMRHYLEFLTRLPYNKPAT